MILINNENYINVLNNIYSGNPEVVTILKYDSSIVELSNFINITWPSLQKELGKSLKFVMQNHYGRIDLEYDNRFYENSYLKNNLKLLKKH